MPKKWQVGVRDIRLLRELANTERGLVATRNGLTLEALTQNVHRIKKRFKRYEWYVSEAREIMRYSQVITDMLSGLEEFNPEEKAKH